MVAEILGETETVDLAPKNEVVAPSAGGLAAAAGAADPKTDVVADGLEPKADPNSDPPADAGEAIVDVTGGAAEAVAGNPNPEKTEEAELAAVVAGGAAGLSTVKARGADGEDTTAGAAAVRLDVITAGEFAVDVELLLAITVPKAAIEKMLLGASAAAGIDEPTAEDVGLGEQIFKVSRMFSSFGGATVGVIVVESGSLNTCFSSVPPAPPKLIGPEDIPPKSDFGAAGDPPKAEVTAAETDVAGRLTELLAELAGEGNVDGKRFPKSFFVDSTATALCGFGMLKENVEPLPVGAGLFSSTFPPVESAPKPAKTLSGALEGATFGVIFSFKGTRAGGGGFVAGLTSALDAAWVNETGSV